MQILKYVLAILYKKKLVTITYIWFRLKALLEVTLIFNLESKIDMATNLDFYADFISNFSYFIFTIVLVFIIFIFYLTFLYCIKFVCFK